MATRTTYKRLDVLSPDPTAAGADLLQDDLKLIDDVIAAIPDGGTAGQILAKASSTDYDTEWTDAPSGGGSVTVDSALSTTSTNPVQNAVVTTAINGKAASTHTHTTTDINNLSTTLNGYATTSALTTGLAGKAASTHTHAAADITSGTLAIARIPTGTTASTVALGNHTHSGYMTEPANEGASGQVLVTNGAGGRSWATVSSGGTTYTAGTGITISGTTISVTTGTYAATSHTHAYSAITGTPTAATTATAGLMSAADKSKLDGIAASANNYTLPTATSSVLGGVKVGTNLSISNGVLSATNTTYNAATTGTAGLMSASDKSKLDGITASADAVSFTQTLTGGTAIGTITINGTGTTLYAPAGSGGSGSSTLSGLTDVTISSATDYDTLIYDNASSAWKNQKAVTRCDDSFTYWYGNDTCTSYHSSGSSPYPSELAHYAGYAYKAHSVEYLPVATTTTTGGIKVGTGLTITDGVLNATGGSGGTGGSNVTQCNDSFSYYNGCASVTHSNISSPYPAELAHYAGYALEASHALTACTANSAETAMIAYCCSGAGSNSTACWAYSAGYASWAGPCYGTYNSCTSTTSYSASSKAAVYESNQYSSGDLITVCPLPPVGPFVVDLMIVWTEYGVSHSAHYSIAGNNLVITSQALLHGTRAFLYYTDSATQSSSNCAGATISDSKLKLLKSFVDGCTTRYADQIIATAVVCGRLVNNIVSSTVS